MYWVVFFLLEDISIVFAYAKKSYSIFLNPSIVIPLLKKLWLYALKYGITIGVIIIGLIFVSSPVFVGG